MLFEQEFNIKGTKECIIILFMIHVKYFYRLFEKEL